MKWCSICGTILAIGVCLAIWQAVASVHGPLLAWSWSTLGLDPPIPSWVFLSSPIDICVGLPDEVRSGQLPAALLETGQHALLAASLAFVIGVVMAEWLRDGGALARSFYPILQSLNGIPPVMLLPVFLIAFGLDSGSVVGMAVFGASLSVLFIVLNGSRQVPADFAVMVSRVGYSKLGAWLWRLSYTSAHLRTAWREGLRWSLILVVVAEMHGTVAGGLGAYVDSGRLNQDYAVVYIGILACGVLSLLFHGLLDVVGWIVHRGTRGILLGHNSAPWSRQRPRVSNEAAEWE